jgi:ACR3 family arsenite transporter
VLNRATGEEHYVAGPSALIGASNFFELAGGGRHQPVRLLFRRGACHRRRRPHRGAGKLSVVWIVNRSKGWYKRGAAVQASATKTTINRV